MYPVFKVLRNVLQGFRVTLRGLKGGTLTRRMVPMMPQGGSVPPRCRRFAYGYALDHSEFPCYLLWPCRDQGEYWLVDTMTTAPQPFLSNLFSTLGTPSLS